MSDQAGPPMQAPVAPAPLPLPTDQEGAVIAAILDLIGLSVKKAREASVPQELDDWGKGILSLAQAATVLDPQRLVGGDHPVTRQAAAPAVPVRDSDGDGQIAES